MSGESARVKAARLRRSAEMWEGVTEAEEATATALLALPPSWTELADISWPATRGSGRRFASVDHVVVGPSGVFVVDARAAATPAAIRDVSAAAASLAALVPSARPGHVHAVLCLDDDGQSVTLVDDVVVCSVPRLVDELTGRPAVLPDGLVGAVAAEVRHRLRPCEHPEPAPPAQRRRLRPLETVVVGVLGLAAAVAVLSQPDAVGSFLTDVRDWLFDSTE